MSPDQPAAPVAGFTLFELVLVLLILAVLAAVALPRIPAGLLGSAPDLQAAQDQLVGDLRQARAGAMVCGNEKTVEVAEDGGEWLIDEDRNCLHSKLEGPRNITGVTFSGNGFEFRYPFGALGPENDVELRLSSGGESRHVCVRGPSGAIRREEC